MSPIERDFVLSWLPKLPRKTFRVLWHIFKKCQRQEAEKPSFSRHSIKKRTKTSKKEVKRALKILQDYDLIAQNLVGQSVRYKLK